MSETDCQKILSQIELFIDQELESGMCGEIEIHLAECEGCADKAEFRVHIKALVAQKCGCGDVPPALVERIMVRLEQDQFQA